MKKLALLSLFAVLFFTIAANAATLYFYAGDFDPNNPNANGLANENDAIVGGNPYGAATYQNFVAGGAISVVGLFTNNLSQLTPTAGYWEVRSGVSEGNGGLLIASGTASGGNFLQTATGRSGFGYTEYTDAVQFADLSGKLTVNTKYWFAVVPICTTCNGRSFNSNTFGLNKIGTDMDNLQFFNSSFFGANYTNANNQGVFQDFSSGVLTIPEPSSILMLGTGLIAVAGAVRRRLL